MPISVARRLAMEMLTGKEFDTGHVESLCYFVQSLQE